IPRNSPSHTAIWPVTTNSASARQPTLPSLRRSPILATPATRLKKISGTTSILMKATNTSPMNLMLSAPGPHSHPVATPSTSAAITRCHSGIRNQVVSIMPLSFRHGEPSEAIRRGKHLHRIGVAAAPTCNDALACQHPSSNPSVNTAQRLKVGHGHRLVALVHGGIGEAEFDHRAQVLEEARIRCAPGGRGFGAEAGFRFHRIGHER